MRWFSLACALCLVAALTAAGPDAVSLDEQTLRAAKVGTDGPALVAYLRKRVVPDVDAGKVRELIQQLGDDDFLTRERASTALASLGDLAVPFLEQASKDRDIEVVRRAEACLKRIGGGYGANVDMAAVRLLAVRKPAGAIEALLGFLPFASNSRVADEVQLALTALAVRDGKPDKALLEALGDKQALKRAAAAVALARAGAADARPAIRKLLQDPDTTVRLRVGTILAQAGDKEAIPVLIDLLPDLSQPLAWQAEDVLLRLAEDQAPAVALGSDAAGRKKCREAWSDWWAKNRDKVDLGKLEAGMRLKGLTLLVFLDGGKVREVDAQGKTIWEVDGIEFPLDAQLLPNGHLLCAEYKGNRVTERDQKGAIVWEHKLPNGGPLVAQRLVNGNTFMATETGIIEVDRANREVFSYAPGNGEGVRKAMRLRNGDIALVTTSGKFSRCTPAGKEILSFPVAVSTNGGRIDVTPEGHVIVPEMASNRVVEYDSSGKRVWECAAEEPIAAVRLPNGNTLVTTLNQKRAIEFDRSGREVWEFKADSRVTRAFRR
jgi:hypothetical protein